MKHKKLFKFILFCMIGAITGLLASNVLADTTQTTHLEQFNKLTGSNFAYDYEITREDFCVAAAKVFMKDHSGNGELPLVDIEQISPESVYYLSALYAKGILPAAEENGQLYMHPDASITRQEILTLLGKVLAKSSESKMTFTDEASIQADAYGYIAWFAENGLIGSYADGNFSPANRMTAGELAELMIKTRKHVQETGMETVFGTGSRGRVDGDRQQAKFTLPYGTLCNNNGSLIVFDTYNNAIRTITPATAATATAAATIETVKTLTGSTPYLDNNGFPKGYYVDGTLEQAQLNRPADGVYNSAGELFFVDSANSVIRHIKGNTIYTFCGTTAGFADGAPKNAKFNNPMAITIDKNNNLYVADTLNNCIRKIDTNGNVTTIAGMAGQEGYRDGAALNALFRAPAGIAVSDDGSVVYVSDTGNHMIRKIQNGQVTTIAGSIIRTDEAGDPLGGFKNGAAPEAMFNLPRGIIVVDGVLIVADSGNNMIRAITKAANVVTIAGNGEPGDFEGSRLEEVLNAPCGISWHGGKLYIADTGNNKIKKMTFDFTAYNK